MTKQSLVRRFPLPSLHWWHTNVSASFQTLLSRKKRKPDASGSVTWKKVGLKYKMTKK